MSEKPEAHERARQLMMAELDGELTGEQRGELERLLQADAGLRDEREKLRRVKEVTREMRLREPPEEVWEGYWLSVYNKIERGIGWVLASLGAVVLLSYGIWEATRELIADPSIPLVVKVALIAAGLGGAILLVSVVREKLFVRRRDPYRGVQR